MSCSLVVLNSSHSELEPTTTGTSSEQKQVLVADSVESIFADRWGSNFHEIIPELTETSRPNINHIRIHKRTMSFEYKKVFGTSL